MLQVTACRRACTVHPVCVAANLHCFLIVSAFGSEGKSHIRFFYFVWILNAMEV